MSSCPRRFRLVVLIGGALCETAAMVGMLDDRNYGLAALAAFFLIVVLIGIGLVLSYDA